MVKEQLYFHGECYNRKSNPTYCPRLFVSTNEKFILALQKMKRRQSSLMMKKMISEKFGWMSCLI